MREQFGRYIVEGELGRGGMAVVYRARDPSFNRQVALKVLPHAVTGNPQFGVRFEREARAVAALEHDAIVPVYDFGEEGGDRYLVMRLLKGGSLEDRIVRGPLQAADLVPIVRRVALALDHAHARGIIHRDVKPANILFDNEGRAFLSDFGIARMEDRTSTLTGLAIVGSPYYMSPEQAAGGRVTPASDVWSLGVTVYECLAGSPPFEDSVQRDAAAIPSQRAGEPPRAARPIDRRIAVVLATAMAKQPAERFASAVAFADAFAAASAPPAPAARPVPADDLTRPAPRKNSPDPGSESEPQSFGPWRREAPHPTRRWAFLCRHETSGERATVEVQSSDDLEWGGWLRKALEVNAALVPLGAERLFSAGRIDLLPAEQWRVPPPGKFQFWVARDERPVAPQPAALTASQRTVVAEQLVALRAAARANGFNLSLPAGDLSLAPDGSVRLARPGLSTGGADGTDWLKAWAVPPDAPRPPSARLAPQPAAPYADDRTRAVSSPPSPARPVASAGAPNRPRRIDRRAAAGGAAVLVAALAVLAWAALSGGSSDAPSSEVTATNAAVDSETQAPAGSAPAAATPATVAAPPSTPAPATAAPPPAAPAPVGPRVISKDWSPQNARWGDTIRISLVYRTGDAPLKDVQLHEIGVNRAGGPVNWGTINGRDGTPNQWTGDDYLLVPWDAPPNADGSLVLTLNCVSPYNFDSRMLITFIDAGGRRTQEDLAITLVCSSNGR